MLAAALIKKAALWTQKEENFGFQNAVTIWKMEEKGS